MATEQPAQKATIEEVDAHVRRLLAAIQPNRYERVLSWAVGRCYHRNEGGVFGWLGDRADDLRVRSQRRRTR